MGIKQGNLTPTKNIILITTLQCMVNAKLSQQIFLGSAMIRRMWAHEDDSEDTPLPMSEFEVRPPLLSIRLNLDNP